MVIHAGRSVEEGSLVGEDRQPMPAILVFDLDGTLIDSAPDMHSAVQRMLAEHGLPPPSLAEVTAMVGDGSAKLLSRAFARAGRPLEGELKKLLPRFMEIYEACAADLTQPYPGVPETLARLQAAGHRMAVCTNKPDRATRTVLQALSLLPFFETIVGGDTAPARKPDPRHLLAVLDRLGAPPSQAVMVGDGANDLLTAAAAGVPAIHARYGYGLREAVAVEPLAAIDCFEELPEALARLRPSRPPGDSSTAPADRIR
jgi:phosphoglycolate phosphatase